MGIEIDIAWLTVLLFGSLAVLLALGLPMAFCTGSLATIFLFVFGNSAILNMMPSRIFPFMTDYQLSAVPLFIFMAAVLERAGIIEELFDAIYKWLGSLKGGLASATVLACTALAAMVGVVGATEVTMGMIALPAMLRRGYDQKLACGSLLAGGTLGILIPPSVMAIVYAVVAQQSLGELLVGSIFPGLMLSGFYIAYITIRCYINPKLGPALPPEERVDGREKLRLLKNTIEPILLILLVLGVIFLGIATPVEAAGIGTFGALVIAALHRRLNWINIHDAAIATLKATAMVMWIFFGATMFVGFFIVKGGQTFVAEFDPGHGPSTLWHPPADDGHPVRPRYVPRLGRHPVAHRADLPANHEGIGMVGTSRLCRGRECGRAAVVRGDFYGQHADGVPVAAIRVFAVLSEERRAARDQHGHDFPLCGELYGSAVAWGRALYTLSADHSVAAKPAVCALRLRGRPAGARQFGRLCGAISAPTTYAHTGIVTLSDGLNRRR